MSGPQQRITLDPEPPVQGENVTITYDFSGLGIAETRLTVRFTPGEEPTTYTVTQADPSVTISVPANATSILVEDLDGPSPDKASAVEPQSVPA